jgi:signal transduction histidine kinase
VSGGFGLGLATVRRIAELMGGSAGLDPGWKGGAAFYLQLPLAKAAV